MTRPLQGRLVREGTPGADEVLGLVVEVGDRLQQRFGELNASMNAAIEQAIEDLDDPELTDMLHASVEGNIVTILHLIRNDIPLDHVQPITAATEYARRLAQRNVGSAALRRAYHIGSDDLLNHMFAEIQLIACAPDTRLRLLHHLAGWMHQYVDWITKSVLDAHEEERRHVHERSARMTSSLVHRVLAHQNVSTGDFASRTGHRLDQLHVGVVMWVDDANQGIDQTEQLSEVARTAAAEVGGGSPPLFTPVDRSTAWAWVGRGRDATPVDVAALRTALATADGVRVALGTPVAGPGGFRRTHDQAEAVKSVAVVSAAPRGRVVSYADDGMAVIAHLAQDVAETRRWVGEVLGPLAADTPGAERLRETVRTFMRTGFSYAQTAEVLMLHRNTVKYRIRQAEKALGRHVTDGRLDLEIAVHACHLLGTTVLDLG